MRELCKSIINTKKRHQKDQQTFNTFDELYRKNLQDSLNDRSGYESFCITFAKFWDETRNEVFFQIST